MTEHQLPARPHLPAHLSFLAAPGEMGRLIAEHDWSTTPLGPLTGWPQSLRTTVSLMLNSSHPLWIGWGPHAIFLYNDAYVEVLSAAKHPWALGLPAAEVWAEIWDFCGPLADKVFQQAEATYVANVQLFMNRGSYLEETWYSFSYSPIVDESGGVGGLFCPSTNVTASNLNTRRLASLSALSAAALREDSVASASETAMATIARNPQDMPFALLYLLDDAGGTALLQGAVHLPPSAGLAPAAVPLEGDTGPWPLRDVCEGSAPVVVNVAALAGLPTGLASQEIRQAIALPLVYPGRSAAAKSTAGVLVLGVNPARRLDTEYRTFFELVAGQVAAALQNATAAEEQRRRTEALAELDRAKTMFFSNVSHEFRTPLTLMLGPVEDALADAATPLPAAHRSRLELAHGNALRLQKLVNTLLDFSRVQAGRMQASYAEVDLAALTGDLASGFRSIVESAGLTLTVDCPPLAVSAWVDASMWEKIVLNLLSNAFKFTFDGGIAVTLRQQDHHAVLTVQDSGVGIPAAHLATIFERFQRVEGARSRSHEGSGIGLALVRDLVDLHHGEIAVRSEHGTGTAFTVTLPLGRAHLPEDHIATRTDGAPSAATLQAYTAEARRWLPAEVAAEDDDHDLLSHGAHVLVVDDNADMRGYLERLLRQRWRVTAVADGYAALEAAYRERPDLIVSDVMMPGLDGFGLIAALRADDTLHDTPVLLLSARAGEEARIEGLNAGADDYLVKPFSARELLTRIDSQLIRNRIRQVEREHAERMAEVFMQAPAAIAILRGPSLVFESVNELYAELIGWREVQGMPMRQALPELADQGIFEELEGVLASGEPATGTARRVMLARGTGGSAEECFFDYVHQPVRNAAGRIDRVAIVSFEVTALVRARRDAEVANRAKDEFLAMLGHELRNPLSPILVALELMRLKKVPGIEKEHAVIQRQASHLVRLVDDLLDVARIAQGKFELRRERVELAGLVTRAVETASPLLEERSHRLTLDVPASGMEVDADPVRFVQVLSNLLTNAAKYTNNGGDIALRAWREGGEIVIAVSDNGIGINREMLSQLFDKFVQERQALDRSRGGLGLGLAIVRSIVALHGGSVQARSDGADQGSVFEVRVPCADGHADADSPEVAAMPPAAVRSRIMLVDDNPDVLDSLRELLELRGHEVHAVPDPASALRLADTLTPDLAILDIGLPGMDGYELAAELRRRPHLQHTRLVALTAYGQQADRERAAAAGFSAHLAKPVSAIDLQALAEG
ncbi:signal transduction histidine kinase [Pseudoduganella lurida]|uniref:histidine kinase n=1 Tax=Pseudoduganella lurida TaxID=1036180 RepID=A0A562RBN4_9BURK|nr:ATP-binding protein [Pseudoduganella lurida]TWI66455.1 signal transduction histidine kinase [Pseudoduganella lurida]